MNPAEKTAAEYFGGMVESYDSLIRRAVPRYQEMMERLMAYVPRRAGRVLELGCGTGNLTLLLAARYPGAEIVAVDAAPKMTGVTGARAGERGAMVRTVTARFEGLEFEAGAFDLVASCMSLHHVVDKGALYEDVFRWMEPGGVLAVADQIRGATEEVQRVHWEAWLRFCREPEHCSEDEVRSLLEHAAAHDHYTALGEHFRLLAAAGFRGIDCVWRDGMYGVVVAVK